MARMLTLIAVAAVGFGPAGCASNWDTMTSRRFREKPLDVIFKSEDPVALLREQGDNADVRARAFTKLTEPALDKNRSPDDQEFVLGALTTAATTDPNPWVRIAAVDALGRFQDPRAAQTLVAAYHQATGRAAAASLAEPEDAPPSVLPVTAGRSPTRSPRERFDLNGPQGFTTDQVATIRGRSLGALAKSGRPEAVQLLAQVAVGDDPALGDDPDSREFVRQQAVAGLGNMRSAEAVQALARVLNAEHGKDLTLAALAHRGLVDLTGQKHPADPRKWNEVLQAGYDLTPSPNGVQRAIGFDAP